MATPFEELQVLRLAETISDQIWREVGAWDKFTRDVFGAQLARAADSMGANIAESYGRFHYGEKINHLYYARGSLFETKYWLNRTRERGLMQNNTAQAYASKLTDLARQINVFANSLKSQRSDLTRSKHESREAAGVYTIIGYDDLVIFTDDEFEWIQSPVSNL